MFFLDSGYSVAAACSMVYILARELNPLTSPALSRFPASQLSGELGSGAESKASTAWHTD